MDKGLKKDLIQSITEQDFRILVVTVGANRPPSPLTFSTAPKPKASKSNVVLSPNKSERPSEDIPVAPKKVFKKCKFFLPHTDFFKFDKFGYVSFPHDNLNKLSNGELHLQLQTIVGFHNQQAQENERMKKQLQECRDQIHVLGNDNKTLKKTTENQRAMFNQRNQDKKEDLAALTTELEDHKKSVSHLTISLKTSSDQIKILELENKLQASKSHANKGASPRPPVLQNPAQFPQGFIPKRGMYFITCTPAYFDPKVEGSCLKEFSRVHWTTLMSSLKAAFGMEAHITIQRRKAKVYFVDLKDASRIYNSLSNKVCRIGSTDYCYKIEKPLDNPFHH